MRTALLAATICLFPIFAGAAPVCAEWQAMRNSLDRVFKEAPIQQMMGNNGSLMELWSSENGESWSITVTFFRHGVKMLCVTASGEDVVPVRWELQESADSKV